MKAICGFEGTECGGFGNVWPARNFRPSSALGLP